jgi:hypothetical protein
MAAVCILSDVRLSKLGECVSAACHYFVVFRGCLWTCPCAEVDRNLAEVKVLHGGRVYW